jgi:hypothetical protein
MIVYTDRGISGGVAAAVEVAEQNHCPVEYRSIR